VPPLTDARARDHHRRRLRHPAALNARRLAAGETVIGKKIGVTSKAVMDMLGVYQPDFGQLTDGMVYNEGEAIPATPVDPAQGRGRDRLRAEARPAGPGRDRRRRAGAPPKA
jgi:hypothetical protein